MEQRVIEANIPFFREYLRQQGLSESRFAELIGVAHCTVNRVLNGKRNPGSKFIAGVLNHCRGVTFKEAFFFVQPPDEANKRGESE